MFFSFRLRFGVALIVLSSLIASSNAADEDVETFFQIGDSETFPCQRQNVGNEDSLMLWAMGTETIFENDEITAGVQNAARYRVEMTESAYDFTIISLTEEDDGAKISCKFDDGDTIKFLKTYRLKLKGVPNAPEILSSQKSSLPYGYRLRWKVPADGGKSIINYGVRWRKLIFEASKLVGTGRWYPEYAQSGRTERDDQYNIYFKLSAEGERTMYKIDKVEEGANYEVEIYARNEIGASEKSRIIFETGKSPGTGRDSGTRLGLSALVLLLSSISLVNLFFP